MMKKTRLIEGNSVIEKEDVWTREKKIMADLLPILPFFIAAILTLFTRGWLRAVIMLGAPFIAAYGLYSLDVGYTVTATIMGFELDTH